jgi:hypothetical protein
MIRLKKIAQRNVRILPNVFSIKNEEVNLNSYVVEFIEKNFIQTRRNLAFDEVGRVLVSHYVLDRMNLEEYLGGPIDDATCKIILDILPDYTKQNLNDKIVEKLQKEGFESKVYKVNYEYGDGVFHVLCMLTEV